MRWRWFIVAFAVAAAGGIGIFLVLAWGATTTETMPAAAARERFDEARRLLGAAEPLLIQQPDGSLARRDDPASPRPGELSQLVILAYDASRETLVEVDMPFWFFELKAPAAQTLVRGTGFDLETLGLSAADLEAQGPALLLDETTGGGSRLMIWTQ